MPAALLGAIAALLVPFDFVSDSHAEAYRQHRIAFSHSLAYVGRAQAG